MDWPSLDWIADPTAWVGLGTLVLLEIVLGIDNLVFIAILADKLPPEQRARARTIGLSLALIMRMVLLVSISWIVGLTQPLFSVAGLPISGRDLILVIGGLFLLFKATMELHERLEGDHAKGGSGREYAVFWQVIAQIIVLDAVFSLDSVITAVGMVDELAVMMIAVIIAVVVMMAAAAPLMRFVSAHPTVVVLCLGFLMMIGFSLVAEGLGFHIPKGYLYAAIGFSILVEAFNQLTQRNRRQKASSGDLRDRTAQAVLRLLGGGRAAERSDGQAPGGATGTAVPEAAAQVFGAAERDMVQSVMTLGRRSVRSIMTPRTELVWLDLDASPETARQVILNSGRSRLPVTRGDLDQLVGVALAKDLLRDLLEDGRIDTARSVQPALLVHEGLGVLTAMERLRGTAVQMAVVLDEYGSVEGVVTPTDLLEAIAGEFPDPGDEPLRFEPLPEGGWLADGQADLVRLEQRLGVTLGDGRGRSTTLTGYLMSRLGHVPAVGDRVEAEGVAFEVASVEGRRAAEVLITGNALVGQPGPG